MKKSYSIVVLAIAAVLAGCTQNNVEKPETDNQGAAVSFAGSTSVDKSRVSYENGASAIKPSWIKGDQVGIFAESGSTLLGDNVAYRALAAGATSGFEIVPGGDIIEWAGETVEHDFYAYYPYSEAGGADRTAIAVSIPAAQTQSGSTLTHLAGCDFMYASAKGITKEDGAVQFAFDHPFTVLEVRMTATGGVALVNSITFSCDAADEPIAFEGTFNLENPDAGVTVTEDTDSNAITLTFSSPIAVTETGTSAFMMISPGHEAKSFKVYADVEGEDDPVLIATRAFEAGQSIPVGKKAVIVADAIDASEADMTLYDKLLGMWSIAEKNGKLDYTMTFEIDEYQKSYKAIVNRSDLGANHPIIVKLEDGKAVIWNLQEMGTKGEGAGLRYIDLHYNGPFRNNPEGSIQILSSIADISLEATPVFNADGSITLAFADDGKHETYIAKSLAVFSCSDGYFKYWSGTASAIFSWDNIVLTKSGMGGTLKDFDEWIWE